MPVIAVQGINEGAGTTSIAAGLAWVLQQLGESVLVIDFSPANMLRLHFDTEFEHRQGWARTFIEGAPWQDSALTYTEQLHYVPFGTLSKKELSHFLIALEQAPNIWQSYVKELISKKHYSWILLDTPPDNTILAEHALNLTNNIILVLNPHMSCHVRLHQQEIPTPCSFLINKFNVLSKIQRDLHKLWLHTLPNLIPSLIHQDEALAESLAIKQPIGKYSAQSLAAEEIHTLANWCLKTYSEPA